jgi:hypothetical protein
MIMGFLIDHPVASLALIIVSVEMCNRLVDGWRRRVNA